MRTDRDDLIDQLCMDYLDALAAENLAWLAVLWVLGDADRELGRAFRGLHDALREEREKEF